ncbi:hypothetical protein JVU11DRAFT_4638 [Chiua virens]|nr:hypothetical protein JVU11DRAFT_4638 [Chiua virens]
MPLLGALFNRRQTTASLASTASNRDSTDADHVQPQPMYNLPVAATSSKLKLPFRRKPPHQPPLVSINDAPHIPSVMSDSGHALPPPPRKSSLFAAHNSSLHSVHSLPNPSYHSDTPNRQSSIDTRSESTPQPHKKSPGLFSWARERTKSRPSQPSSSPSPPTDDPPSFNLMSFRHVRADSAAPSENSPLPSSVSLLPPARPRPRGDSVASDSSQRISVAAFKEAQARSRANSPVPSFRPPSTADTLRFDANGRKRASTVSVLQSADSPQSNENFTPLTSSTRPASSAPDTSSDESEDEDDEEVDSDGEPIPNPTRKPTIQRPSGGIHTRSDTGHPINQVSHFRQGPLKLSKPAPQLTHHSDQAPYMRQHASVSTSALAPNGARASTLAAANSSTSSHGKLSSPHHHRDYIHDCAVLINLAHHNPSSRKPNHDSDESSDSSDTDSEDLPLSDLVAPRRPGSSTSNYSNGRPRIPAKPLIDINSLATRPPLLTPILRHENSVKNLNTRRKEQEVQKDQPFSIPVVLALSSSASSSISPSASKQNTTPVSIPTSVAHRRSSGDVKGPDNDDDLINAIRLVGTLDKEQEQPSLASKLTSNRIVPTPIRAREPPTSFTVLSRPPQRQSTADTSSSLSPVSQTRFTTSPSSLSSQSETGARQRASTMINPVTQSDKSDTISVSARSSTSRTSSRIPPVPLIHSIPNSPSVKEAWKSGRPPSAPRTSAANVSSATSNKLPQRPFASTNSIRGESPAGSSTGDSSSGRAPFTPRDGSDIGVRSKDDPSDVGSTLKARGHAKKPSVTFEDQPVRGRERAKTELTSEEKTRERRRSEAKAALEVGIMFLYVFVPSNQMDVAQLGKIVNGRGPLVRDEDEDMTLRGRNPTINVTMDNGMMQPGWAAWQQPMGTGMSAMVSPQFGNDPAYLAAHQHALFIAKQAYQMAVAQQAMQMAGEEWERGSNVGFGSGGSVYGGGSGGSVYGGGSGGSVYGGAGMGPMNMMGMPNMGMLMPPNQWGRSSVAFPSTPSVYGISSSQSEYGGGGWGTRSVYGDSFGPSTSHPTFMGNGTPNSSASAYGGNSRPRASTGASPSLTSSSQPTRTPGKSAVRSRAAPPSSWKNGR